MSQRKVFIAISLPPEVKKRLAQKTEKWAGLPVKWEAEENLHITLNFLGYIDDARLPRICAAAGEAAKGAEIFEICLSRITVGLSAGKPRMVWATGEKNENLKKLQEDIERGLGTFVREKREFRPHVTLGRIRHEKWKTLDAPPEISEKINFVIPVGSVEILESVFKEGKRKYLLLESCPLGGIV